MLKHYFLRLIRLFNSARDEQLSWRAANQDQVNQLNRAQKLAKAELSAELQLKNARLEHDLALLKTRQAAELGMLKTRCKTDINDYRQYLDALEQLKTMTKTSFGHLPDAVALTIHHHAKSLLNRMWEASTEEEKIRLEHQLLAFMTTVHKEAEQCRLANSVPESTLALIKLEQSN